MAIEKNTIPPKKQRVKEKWREAFHLEPRDPETKQGDAAVFPIEDYSNISRSLIPRWNKRFAPKKWTYFVDRKDGKQVVKIQRVK